MKRMMYAIIAVVMIFSIVGCQQTSKDATVGGKEYKGEEGWSFQYPAKWDRVEDGFVQETSTGKTISFRSDEATEEELAAWLDSELIRKLTAEEADNSLVGAMEKEEVMGMTVYRYTIESKGDGKVNILKTVVFHKGNQWVELHTSMPPVEDEEFEEIIKSFKF